jgi:hypothetical protein
MGRYALLAILAAVFFGTACENEFSPKTDIINEIAVFCILDEVQEFQTVLLFRSYDAQLGIPLQPLTDKEIDEADVRIIGGGKTYQFRDTLISDKSGATRRAWINRELIPISERTYRLELRIPDEDLLTAVTTVPSRLYVRALRVRADTGRGHVSVSHGVTAFSAPPGAFYYRIWSETWKILSNGDTVRSRLEVPLYINNISKEWIYSSPSRSEATIFTPDMIADVMEMNESEDDSVIARRLYVHGYGMDEQFYKYYKVVRGFDDPISVRLDMPDLSFIEGGLGVFGSMTSDSTSSSIYSFIR